MLNKIYQKIDIQKKIQIVFFILKWENEITTQPSRHSISFFDEAEFSLRIFSNKPSPNPHFNY